MCCLFATHFINPTVAEVGSIQDILRPAPLFGLLVYLVQILNSAEIDTTVFNQDYPAASKIPQDQHIGSGGQILLKE